MGAYYISTCVLNFGAWISGTDDDSTTMMDPHSTFSRFNHRVTKAGPASRTVERVKIPSTSAKKLTQADLAVLRRPIATNSRVKQDEIVKRDMYLSFVSNALDQKALVCRMI